QPLRADRRESPVLRQRADAARPQPLSRRAHPRGHREVRRRTSGTEEGDLRRTHRRRTSEPRSAEAQDDALSREVPQVARQRGLALAQRRCGHAGQDVRQVPPPPRQGAARRQLLSERSGVGRGDERPEDRCHLRSLRNLPRGLLGVKTSYGAAVMIRNEPESRKLAVFQKYVPDIQDALPLPAEDRPSKHGHASPMEVMDTPFRAGDLRHGYQAVADNLPNDPKIHQQAGSKKIFFKNYMDARVNDVILPVAKR